MFKPKLHSPTGPHVGQPYHQPQFPPQSRSFTFILPVSRRSPVGASRGGDEQKKDRRSCFHTFMLSNPPAIILTARSSLQSLLTYLSTWSELFLCHARRGSPLSMSRDTYRWWLARSEIEERKKTLSNIANFSPPPSYLTFEDKVACCLETWSHHH